MIKKYTGKLAIYVLEEDGSINIWKLPENVLTHRVNKYSPWPSEDYVEDYKECLNQKCKNCGQARLSCSCCTTVNMDESKFEAGTSINEKGAKESKLNVRFDLLPMDALLEVSEVLHTGAEKYGENNWRNLSVETNINHAFYHLASGMCYPVHSKRLIANLRNAACRVLFALELALHQRHTEKP